MNGRYRLRCYGCESSTDTELGLVQCRNCGPSALLRTEYAEPLRLAGPADAFFSYAAWLPFENLYGLKGPRISCVQSAALGQAFGLRDLWVQISGHAPQYGSNVRTGSFKETEAIGILSRIRAHTDKTLIVPSAGNAARALLDIAIQQGCQAVIVVPDSGEKLLRLFGKPTPNGPLLVIIEKAFYGDAIHFVEQAHRSLPDQLVRDGGGYNVARRDAMGVTFLRAVTAMQGLPDRYVQAVGSGTGALAAWEASQRLLSFGLVRPRKMRLHLMQNVPFTPMVEAWRKRSREFVPWGQQEVNEKLAQTYASVLSNSTPPYAVRGGIYDALQDTNGEMDGVINEQILEAEALVTDALGVKPCPASATAAAGLLAAVRDGRVDPDERVLLHMTGTSIDHLVGARPTLGYARRVQVSSTDEGLAAITSYLSQTPLCRAAGSTP